MSQIVYPTQDERLIKTDVEIANLRVAANEARALIKTQEEVIASLKYERAMLMAGMRDTLAIARRERRRGNTYRRRALSLMRLIRRNQRYITCLEDECMSYQIKNAQECMKAQGEAHDE